MINSRINRPFLGGAGGYLPQTVALLAAMSVQPNAARATLINTTILSLIAAGIWNSLDFIFMLWAHDQQAADLNWKNPAVSLTRVNSPTFAVDLGYTGDGVSMALSVAYTPVLLTQNSASLSIVSLTTGSGAVGDLALTTSASASRGRVIGRSGVSGSGVATSGGTLTASLQADAVPRLISADRENDSSNSRLYTKGVLDNSGAVASASVGAVDTAWFLSSGLATFSDRQIAMGAVGTTLGATKQAAFYAAMQNYGAALGVTLN